MPQPLLGLTLFFCTVYWKAANLTSIFDPTLYPNLPQHHPTQADTPRRDPPEIRVC